MQRSPTQPSVFHRDASKTLPRSSFVCWAYTPLTLSLLLGCIEAPKLPSYSDVDDASALPERRVAVADVAVDVADAAVADAAVADAAVVNDLSRDRALSDLSTTQDSAAQDSTTQDSAAQDSAAQDSAAQDSAPLDAARADLSLDAASGDSEPLDSALADQAEEDRAPLAVCGDNEVSGAEQCDDGNQITEVCAYGALRCQVCANDCQLIDGETSFCGDGVVNGEEACDGVEWCEDDCARSPDAPPCFPDCPELDWVRIIGGAFMMGSPPMVGDSDERPQRQVVLSDFELMRSEVTVAQYRVCVDAGVCSAPFCDLDTEFMGWRSCNYAHNGRALHPVNHVTWGQLRAFAAWVGADLPTEAQWEFAARNRGQNITYPWGDAAPNCMRADWDNNGDDIGCNGAGTSPVCTFQGPLEAELCDLAGNLWEWVRDEYAESYAGAPHDGSARCTLEDCSGDAARVYRGGSWRSGDPTLRAAARHGNAPSTRNSSLGGRLSRSAR